MARMDPVSFTTRTGTPGILRNPEPDDAESLLRALQSVVNEGQYLLLSPGEVDATIEEEVKWLQDFNEAAHDLYLLATVGDSLAGSISLTQSRNFKRRHMALLGMFLVPEWRGQGIGALMLETALNWARQDAMTEKMYLEVFGHNIRAIRLYKKFGFVEEGLQMRHAKTADGEYYNEVLMGLLLK